MEWYLTVCRCHLIKTTMLIVPFLTHLCVTQRKHAHISRVACHRPERPSLRLKVQVSLICASVYVWDVFPFTKFPFSDSGVFRAPWLHVQHDAGLLECLSWTDMYSFFHILLSKLTVHPVVMILVCHVSIYSASCLYMIMSLTLCVCACSDLIWLEEPAGEDQEVGAGERTCRAQARFSEERCITCSSPEWGNYTETLKKAKRHRERDERLIQL